MKPRPSPPRAVTVDQPDEVLKTLHEARFVDLAPAEVYATLLDEGRYPMLRAHDVPDSRGER